MSSIKDYLTHDHRKCDDMFADMEKKATNSFMDAHEAYKEFAHELEKHFQMEEKVMFLEFEAKTGMTQGPTQMMRQEHSQMRGLLSQMADAFDTNNQDKFFGLSETLMILMQQHNMKEEQMLYPMAQQHLSADANRIITMMESIDFEL